MKEAHEQGFAVARVVPEHRAATAYQLGGDAAGFTGIPCPAETRGVTCDECRLCLKADWLHREKRVILFTPHGSRRRKLASELIQIGE